MKGTKWLSFSFVSLVSGINGANVRAVTSIARHKPNNTPDLLVEHLVQNTPPNRKLAWNSAWNLAVELCRAERVEKPLYIAKVVIYERNAKVAPIFIRCTSFNQREFRTVLHTKTHGFRVEDIQAVKASEHYVQVYTDDGSELIHHKFGAAIAELPAVY